MTLPFAAPPASSSPGQVAAAVALAALAAFWLLPRPRGRSVAFGTFAGLAAVVVLVSWMVGQFGPVHADGVAAFLFWLFAAGAVGFAAAFVAQRNPARGAIAFAFVILSVCGLFLTLAAPFLMAATVVIYAGAIIVTFLFVLMLSQTRGQTDENDRSREPLLGALAGFGFLGLVLFALQQSASDATAAIPARPVTQPERAALLTAAAQLKDAGLAPDIGTFAALTKTTRDLIADAVGPVSPGEAQPGLPIPDRLKVQADPRAKQTAALADKVRDLNQKTFDTAENRLLKPNPTPADLSAAKASLGPLREQVLLLAGQGELPARNVANLGYVLYSDYLLAVEMAGALLLVATIGAVAIAGRKGAVA